MLFVGVVCAFIIAYLITSWLWLPPNNEVSEVRFWHWLLSPLTGYVEHRRLLGWSGFLPFYKAKCPIHGEYVTYPQGYWDILVCPKCRQEEKQQ